MAFGTTTPYALVVQLRSGAVRIIGLNDASRRGKPGGFPHSVLEGIGIKIDLCVIGESEKDGEKRKANEGKFDCGLPL